MVQSNIDTTVTPLKADNLIWREVVREAEKIVGNDPLLAPFIYDKVLNQNSLSESIATRVADRLHSDMTPAETIRAAYKDMIADQPVIASVIEADVMAVYERDPVCERFIEPILYFKGFHALQNHRLANWLWGQGRRDFALMLQSRASEFFQIDIHPAVTVGKGIFFDHGTGIVIGATSSIDDDVSILQNVTLGGTGKETGDRHPKIGKCVLIGAGAKVLGNIEIGHCSRIAAGSVVLKPVRPYMTVAGVPAKEVGSAGCPEPSRSMNQILANKEAVSEGDKN